MTNAMTQAAEVLNEIDERLQDSIDPTLYQTERQYALPDFPVIAREIKRLESEIEQIDEYKKAELDRIRESSERKKMSKQNSIAYLLQRAEMLLAHHDKEKYDMPGVGRFSFKLTTQSVDTTDYDALSEEKQTELHQSYPDLFAVKYSPNKKAIKEALAGATGGDFVFRMTAQERKLYFKGE